MVMGKKVREVWVFGQLAPQLVESPVQDAPDPLLAEPGEGRDFPIRHRLAALALAGKGQLGVYHTPAFNE